VWRCSWRHGQRTARCCCGALRRRGSRWRSSRPAPRARTRRRAASAAESRCLRASLCDVMKRTDLLLTWTAIQFDNPAPRVDIFVYSLATSIAMQKLSLEDKEGSTEGVFTFHTPALEAAGQHTITAEWQEHRPGLSMNALWSPACSIAVAAGPAAGVEVRTDS
jgi:hypothetical protein